MRRSHLLNILLLSLAFSAGAQRHIEKKYPALLWEITGKGLKKPSYLFGTMHISSKLVFHLSDSFYVDIKNADVVALELDPQLWQDQLFRFENLRSNLRFYTQGAPTDYINEHSFQLERYEDPLRSALSDEPTVINGLLYRTYRSQADFEEDTYLDLYIYQTGRKLGKQATGVENYFQTERLMMEAAQDMMKDKKKRTTGDNDGESAYDIERKTQDAYRKGDLDLLDSLERLMEPSQSYMEKFLYRRNEIQAASIDSIVQRHSLFVGVGAAHLPGKRGVIELLRRKGYTLRPVMMPDQDATRRDDIDKIRVPVSFSLFSSPDGAFSVQLPGKLYRRTDSRSPDSWQYADMSNGAYYMIDRVRTHASFLGEKNETLLKKVDSLLYENIPGKILKKTPVTRNGYKGFDITARTRRGDIQRYNILVTPYEVWVFKMSGNNNYVDGPEADRFFNSIHIRNDNNRGWNSFIPARGGFTIRWPHTPAESKDMSGTDGPIRWEYEAADSLTGNSYLLWKSTVQNYRCLEEDTADLALMEQSFRASEYIDHILSRRIGRFDRHDCIDATYQGKDGSFIRAKFILHGADYYVLAAHSRGKERTFAGFFDSFAFTPYVYPHFRDYVDSFMHISVTTPMVPDVDAGMRRIVERASSEEFLNSLPDYNNYWPRPKTALFQDDSTGEAVYVSVETFPKYYYPKDTATFWRDETSEKRLRRDLVITARRPYRDGARFGYRYTLTDTNTTRRLDMWAFLDGRYLFRVVSLTDSLQDSSAFLDRFYSTLKPFGLGGQTAAGQAGPGPGGPAATGFFASKLDTFFHDFYSKDSLVAKKAREAIPNVYFGPAGVPLLLNAINGLPYNDNDYLETKTKLINELGYIDDSIAIPGVVAGLKSVYEKAGDTSILQNAVLKALAHHKTTAAYALLGELMSQDPPVFDNSSDYNYFFRDIGDSLALARSLFPGLLQLATIDDYKSNIQSLLADLVDSNYLHAADYTSYFSQIYFDAKIAWKKQEGKDEKKWQKQEDAGDDNSDPDDDNQSNGLNDYAILLEPFYNRNPTIPHFFDKLLQSRDASLRLTTSVLLLRRHHDVPDSLLQSLAADDATRAALFQELTDIHQQDRFPEKYRTQESIARSLLVAGHGGDDFAAIELVARQPAQFKQTKGSVYFFRYKITKDDPWMLGLSGIQPVGHKDISTESSLVVVTGKKIHEDTPEMQQFQEQWRRLLLSRRKSAANFFQDNEYALRQDDDQ